MNKQDLSFEYVIITPSKEDCVYTSCYCEENIWKLCEYIKAQPQHCIQDVYAVFISNERRMVPLWKQKSCRRDQPVVWDYHVILLHTGNRESYVYDLDTTLPFPCPLSLYEKEAFRSDHGLKESYWRKLRVIPAETFLSSFASDRSHMKDEVGHWRMLPPSYPCLETAESKMNLDSFISMDAQIGWGKVYSLAEFVQHFGGKGRPSLANDSHRLKDEDHAADD
ncbi:protein N-terminal glutamine amidohydrolase isoform X2 [Clupea harengus]|uniref:Protein N-terminal glutamine amidohydrolase n=1 Tax=Clupea harengus TaxID=7950 RepID=A0A6P3VJN1_CLUHA|nr:protein N-terminal glutamine amidohydrolase isoform X2 [Clupea harengus]